MAVFVMPYLGRQRFACAGLGCGLCGVMGHGLGGLDSYKEWGGSVMAYRGKQREWLRLLACT
jgi:hypothetical protein